ncbi:acyltransferase family protein [Luteipulveratus sp. YIM 133132]|uniref:acyltransferase family protein n=1 Tax=Luteipulveratus flavus TaxID=3031728 RepID=UPI0023B052B5|nr:acyltransferase family protein [Luteipulveratus sp. YIM 133132]MDE9365991.1 acyltransferase family protein [Luteipulveratus sp. YIM 133132]
MSAVFATRRSRRSGATSAPPVRFAAMDGYRGLFVILVVLYHLGVTRLAGGWIGINHFFVFSGFLITRILLSEHARTGRIDAIAFYVRRARRVLPAMLVLVAAVLVATLLIGEGEQRRLWGGDAAATLGFFLNWRLVQRNDAYFDQFGMPSPLRHAWTLSVEEQFYLVVPFLLLGLCVLARRRALRSGVVLALAVGAAVWTAHLAQSAGPSRLYYGTDTRVQALLVGVAVGFLLGRGSDGRRPALLPRAATEAMGWVGFATSLSAVFLLDEATQWVYTEGGVLLFALAAGLVAWSAVDERPSPLNRLMSLRPLPYLGRISYGIYLYHWPIHLWVPLDGVPRPLAALVQLVLTLAAAAASYRYLEAPVLAHGLRGLPLARRGRRWTLGPAVAAVLAGSVLLWSTPAPALSERQPDLVAGQRAYDPGGSPQRISVLGDSVAQQLADDFPAATYPGVSLRNQAREGCDLLPATATTGEQDIPVQAPCRTTRERWPADFRSSGSQVLVVLAWTMLAYPHRAPDGTVVRPGDPRYAQVIDRGLDDLLARLGSAGRLQLVTLPCRDLPSDQTGGRSGAGAADLAQVRRVVRDPSWVNGVLKSWAARHPGAVHVIDLQAATCPRGYEPTRAGVTLFADRAHFSRDAAPMVWKWLLPQIQASYAPVR